MILLIFCSGVESKKKRVIIHVPEKVIHVHHHITKKVPLPIVVFAKHKEHHKEEPKYVFHEAKELHEEPKYLKEAYKAKYVEEPKEYYDSKDSYQSLTEEHAGGYEPEYAADTNHLVTRGGKDVDYHIARGVVADYHAVKSKELNFKPHNPHIPIHLLPPRQSKAKPTESYWSEERENFNYGSFKPYNPPIKTRPTSDSQYFEMGPSHHQSSGDHVTHVYPTEIQKTKKKKKSSKLTHRRTPYSMDSDSLGSPQWRSNYTNGNTSSYVVNGFLEDDFRRTYSAGKPHKRSNMS
ncbi:hypothetical protein WDU94_000939 [Cyamophila willieti]